MCRHVGYLGPPIPLSAVLFDPPHSLERQSWAPKDMRGGGTINADGFGVAWYQRQSDGSGPIRYRRERPLWTDPDLRAIARAIEAGSFVAAVRSATIGMPVTESAAAPFLDGRWLFSLNGIVTGWPDSLLPLASRLPTRDLVTLEAPTDAALLWALVRHRLREGVSLVDAVRETVVEVVRAAPGSRLNVLASDGDAVVATTFGHALSLRANDGAVLISSEPLDDDPAWRSVPECHLVHATRLAVDVVPLSTE